MSTLLVVAAGLCILGGALHSALGEKLIFAKVTPEALSETLEASDFVVRTLRLFWHLVSVAWLGFAAILWTTAPLPLDENARQIVRIVALTFCVSAIVAFLISKGKHFSWGMLLTIAVLAWLGGQ